MRYVLSTYNTSNALAVHMVDERYCPSPEIMTKYINQANVRFFTPEFFFFTGQIETLRNYYWPRLTPDLQKEIEPTLLKPTGVFKQFRVQGK